MPQDGRPETSDGLAVPPGVCRSRSRNGRAWWRPEAVRGRVLLVFQGTWDVYGGLHPGALPVAVIARELGVTRQAIYAACPELIGRRRGK